MAKKGPKPWEMQPGETSKQYWYFCVYRDLKTIDNPASSRSIREVGEKTGKTEAYLERLSSENGWVKRVAAWDLEQERIAREVAEKERISDVKKMRKRQAALAQSMLLKAAQALQKMDIEDMKPGDISRMVDVASKLERISRGDVGDVVEERQGEAATPAVTFYMPSNSRDDEDADDTDEE